MISDVALCNTVRDYRCVLRLISCTDGGSKFFASLYFLVLILGGGMTLRLEDKQHIVAKVTEVAERSMSLVAAHYRGMSVAEIESLRMGKKNGVIVKIVRNTLARRALSTTSFKDIEADLTGPTLLIFAQDEPGAAAKLAHNFIKKNDKLSVQGLVVDGALLPASELKSVAAMPTKDEALSMLAGTLLAPVTGVARTSNEVVASLARALDAYAEKAAA